MAKRGRVLVERKRKRARQRVEETKQEEEEEAESLSDDSDADVHVSSRSQSSDRAVARADDRDDEDDEEDDDDSATVDVDDDDGDALDFTQPDYALQVSESQALTSTQESSEASRSKANAMPSRVGQMSAKAIEDLTALLVRYMLYKVSQKLPIKFADISKDVFPKYKNVSRYFFQKAKQQLESVFGYRVVAVDESATKELYLVLNAQTSQEHLLLMNKNGKSPARGFLMMVLGLLWCAQGRRLVEEDLWKQLALLDPAIKPTRDHPQLGDIAGLLKTFENQLYLHTSSEFDVDLKKIKFYAYGPRTLLEVGKVQILNFVCKLVTGRPPTDAQVDELALEDQ